MRLPNREAKAALQKIPAELRANKGLKVAVMGAGAVGCYYGGMLARGAHGSRPMEWPPTAQLARSRSGKQAASHRSWRGLSVD